MTTPSADELVKLLNQSASELEKRQSEWVESNLAIDAADCMREAAARILALESQLARMGEALRPFSVAADHWKYFADADELHIVRYDGIGINSAVTIRLADLRRAAEALSSTPAVKS